METDFSASFLLVETIIEIRRNWVFKKLFLLGKAYSWQGKRTFRSVKTIFFLHFSETPVSFFPSRRKVFFNEILHSSWWKQIFWLIETVFDCSEFFL